MHRSVVRFFPAVLLLAAACGEGAVDTEAVLVSTGRAAYTREAAHADVDFFIVNQGGRRIEISPCGETFTATVERRVGGGWEEGGDLCPMSLAMGPFLLDPGARADRGSRVEAEGVFRVRVTYRAGGGQRTVYSNDFTVD